LCALYSKQCLLCTNSEQRCRKVKIGVVSAGGAATLDELVARLSAQADKQGATYFKVISTSGANKMHGVADIYK
jgi:multiple stress resistance protein BhsA